MNIYITDNINDKNAVHINNLHTLENGFFESIDIKNMLDKVKQKERSLILQMCIQKIQYGGKLFVENTDMISLSKALIIGKISIEQFAEYMNNVASGDSVNNTIKELVSKNMRIEQLNFNEENFTYDIVAIRNE